MPSKNQFTALPERLTKMKDICFLSFTTTFRAFRALDMEQARVRARLPLYISYAKVCRFILCLHHFVRLVYRTGHAAGLLVYSVAPVTIFLFILTIASAHYLYYFTHTPPPPPPFPYISSYVWQADRSSVDMPFHAAHAGTLFARFLSSVLCAFAHAAARINTHTFLCNAPHNTCIHSLPYPNTTPCDIS